MKSLFSGLVCLVALAGPNAVRAGLPDKIYGVNIGGWLVIEPWMMPTKWVSMGGQICDDCSQCISSEYALAQAFPSTVDHLHVTHWETWFTQDDINQLAAAGINLVRIPLGYWIVEDLVNRATEFFPRGGLSHLKWGVAQLKAAGIKVLLDHHALPGVAAVNQMFAGHCTADIRFYTEYNYHRALVWTAVMAAISHYDPDFGSVVGIEAVNEPIQDATRTPGYGDFQKNFVGVVRAVEILSGISVPGFQFAQPFNVPLDLNSAPNFIASSSAFSPAVSAALTDAFPIIMELGIMSFGSPANTEALVTNFMDVHWQYNNSSNPADAANGPQAYDNHLYYSFGGVADPNEEAYFWSICNLDRIQADMGVGDSPLFFGEWSLATQFDASDDFITRWADAQKWSYSKGKGWIFWNFKVEADTQYIKQWSYIEGLRRGYLTQDPSQLKNPHVCDNYTMPPLNNIY